LDGRRLRRRDRIPHRRPSRLDLERRAEHRGGAFASSAAPRQCSHACACNGATLKRLVKPHPHWTPKERWERPPL
jgi:hypothetical protein